MNDDEIRAFLMRWVMEMGDSVFDWRAEDRNAWYESPHTIGVNNAPELYPYFNITRPSGGGIHTLQINQAGLDFIKGE